MDRLTDIEAYWSRQAHTFDDEPDHGLGEPRVRAAWADLLGQCIPSPAARIADLGCGTGSLSVLLAEAGAEVVGVDLSREMIRHAHQKAQAAGLTIEFRVGDAGRPDLPAEYFDVVLSRHLLWTLPTPVAALAHWGRLLTRKGRLVLIEGQWFDRSASPDNALPWDGGVASAQLIEVLEPMFSHIDYYPLSSNRALWGKTVSGERYAVVAHTAIPQRSEVGPQS